VIAPNGASAYVVNSGLNAVSAYAVGEGGALRPLSTPVTTEGKLPFGIAITPDGSSVYVSNVHSGTVSAFGVNADGTLTRLGEPVPSGADNPRGIAVSRDGRFLFVGHGIPNASATDVVTTFAINGNGTLRRVGEPTSSGGAGTGMVTSPNGRFLYIDSTNTDRVFGYKIGRTGTLTPLAGSPFPVANYPEGAAITPDGRHLYVSSPGPDRANPAHAVSAFTVGANGALIPVAGSPFTAGDGPVGIATSSDGRHLYATNVDSSTVSAFTIAPSGALQEIQESPFPTGGQSPAYQSVAVLPAHR
jgi:6-phosphogluconolactonase (cycloisomerase 2 family)